MSDEQKEADGTAVRFSNRLCAKMLVTVVRVLPFAIEKVVRLVRHKRLIAYVVHRGTLLWRREPSRGVHALDKGGRRQYAPAPGPALTPASGSVRQAMASFATKRGSVEGIALPPRTMLVSFECCQVARILPSSNRLGGTGLTLGLKKWVVSCVLGSKGSNNVA